MDERKAQTFPVTLFYVYAHPDEKLRRKLEKHLSILSRQGLINTWYDRRIMPGADWQQVIDDHLNTASIILLLISPDFIASDYCYGIEMQRALARHEEGSACVIPIILRPVDWREAPFSSLQALPHDGKPVTTWRPQDAAFVDVTENIRRTLEALCSPSPLIPSPSQDASDPPPHQDLQSRLYQRDQLTFQQQKEVRSKYLNYIQARYTSVRLPLGPSTDFSLQAVFQPLRLRRDPLAAEDREREERRALLGEILPHPQEPQVIVMADNGSDALAKSPQRRLVILGGPGTGKTTLLRSLMSHAIEQAQSDFNASLPIFLSLPDLASSLLPLQDYLLRHAKEAGISTNEASFLWHSVEDGRAFVCLDSLDEVLPKQRPIMIQLLNEVTATTGSTWIIGSRFTDYKGGQFKRGQFMEWELLPLDHSLRQHLAQRLLPELHSQLPTARDMDQDEPTTFVSWMEAHPTVAAWGENPLLFSLAAVVFVWTGILPANRATLYQYVIDAIFALREPDATRRRMLRQVVADLALELYKTKGRIFTHEDIVDLVPVIRQRHNEIWPTDEIITRVIASGILEVVAQETYGFRHHTNLHSKRPF